MKSEEISVETGTRTAEDGSGVQHQVTITDHKASRAWSGTGQSVAEAATHATRKFLGDRRAREYVS